MQSSRECAREERHRGLQCGICMVDVVLLWPMVFIRCTVVAQAAVPVADGGDVGAAGYEAALDGLQALRAVLRDEHSLLTQYKMIVWGRVFTPVQVCLCSINAVSYVHVCCKTLQLDQD